MVHISIVVCCTAFVLSTIADAEEADTELVNGVGSTAFMVNGDRAFAGGFVPNFPKMSDRAKTYLEEWKQIRKNVPPLFFDSFSPIFFNDYTWQIFESFVALDNFSEMDDRGMMMGLRTVFVDAAVRRAIAAGTKQVVFLGSGLDTKALKLHTRDVTTFEVDQKPVMTYKLKKLAEAGYPVYPAKTIMGNYFEIDLFEELKKAGMDLTAPTLFVWEGNQMYIPLDLTKSLLTKLFKTVPNSEVMFDSIAAEGDGINAVLKAMEDLMNGGKELFFGRADVPTLAGLVGAKVVHSVNMYQFAMKTLGGEAALSSYLLDHPDRLKFFKSFSPLQNLNIIKGAGGGGAGAGTDEL